MPHITHITIDRPERAQVVPVPVDRHTLERRRWRARAADGRDLAVDLEAPCRHGDVLLSEADRVYVVEQAGEPVLVIPLPADPGPAAALGWFFGNQHLPVEVRAEAILVADHAHLRALLERHGIQFSATEAVFSPDPHSRVHHHHH